ncbi:S41 family peptidase [Lishizhenia sp.]|uniref:S41 family peptidase n=1 Tax=Lishizhenia sp. TaxID=2497594 RepID=UPI00299D9C67|nr:S41 family peptidase [Lishizhenia sp.]MDX1446191.1 S41 family peptidase [Lishizhenia sp.]
MKKYLFVVISLLCFYSTSKAQSNSFEVIKSMELMDLIYMNLEKYYVDEPNTGELSKTSIDAMLRALDPYTVYYHEANIEDFRMMNTGQYGGIGATIRKVGEYTIITEPYKGNPAYNAGLEAGDIILSIDGRDMKNRSSEEVSNALKGLKGSEVIVQYKRPDVGEGEAKIIRDEIKLPDVPYSGMIDDKVGYIALNSFTQTASANVSKAFQSLKQEGMESLVLDLRNNGGGLLMEAVKIVNMFVPKGQVVVSTKSRVKEENRVYVTQQDPLDLEIPLVVLINEGSASASEIVSGTLQDLDRAVVVGRTSFGKGLVQRTVDLKYGSKMKLTIAKYYTPSGRCVQKLDYSNKVDGQVDEVPDSLLQIFYTKNGREVIDGRGIEPDISVEGENMSRLAAMLLAKNIIFDYATHYKHKHDSIAAPEEFVLSDKAYDEFIAFALSKEFSYNTASEEKMKEVVEVAKMEGYFESTEKEIEALLAALKPSKKEDLIRFKTQIKEMLQNEIVARYYYQEGRVLNSFISDKSLEKAMEVLNNEKLYNSTLHINVKK